MIGPLLVLAVALAAAAEDPCAPVEAAGEPDPAAAAEYRAVGDAERAAGSRDTATAAYRAALARDPGDRDAREALGQLCSEASSAGAFERGLALMRAGDRAGAVAAFEEARAGKPDASAALLEGISLYELGDDTRARPLLEEAAKDPVHRDPARFFLGLAALRQGRTDEATALLEASAADQRLGPMAMDLARIARRDGRVVLSFLVDGGFDSNTDLTPDGGGKGVAPAGDASGGLTALARVSPLGDTGPFVRGTAVLRDQVRYETLDLRGGGFAGGWQGGRAGRYLLAEYGWEGRYLGGTPYLSAHRLLGAARADLWRNASAGLTYFARWESFLPDGYAEYSGLRQFAEADVVLPLWPRSSAVLAWHGGLDAAEKSWDSWKEHGPRASLRFAVGRDTRLQLDAALTWRLYDQADAGAGLSSRQADTYVDMAGAVERELGDRWTLRASLLVRKALSNVAAYSYTRVVPTVGLAWTLGLF